MGQSFSPDIVVCFELDNASESGDPELLVDSYRSVIATAAKHLVTNSARLSIVSVVSGEFEFGGAIARRLRKLETGCANIVFERVINPAGTYFGAKNAALEFASEDAIVVLTDSDCVYDTDYLTELLAGFCDRRVRVVYGKTYARFVRGKLRERAAALCWQFPPEDIGYGAAWPRSRWANNMAVTANLFVANPFPEVHVDGTCRNGTPLQLKVERVLWADELDARKTVVADGNGKAVHRLPSSYGEFASRAYIHGVAEAFFSRYSRDGKSGTARATVPLLRRWQGLRRLRRDGRIGWPELLASAVYLATAAVCRTAGAIAFRSMTYEVKRKRGGPPHRARSQQIQ